MVVDWGGGYSQGSSPLLEKLKIEKNKKYTKYYFQKVKHFFNYSFILNNLGGSIKIVLTCLDVSLEAN
jgi:phosphomannomutase